MIRMKALRSFGYHGSNEGHIKRGREFTVDREHRARDLEDAGLAFRLETKMQAAPENKMETPPENKAAETGPLDSPGGETGEEELPPSSHQAPRRGRRRSGRLKVVGSQS